MPFHVYPSLRFVSCLLLAGVFMGASLASWAEPFRVALVGDSSVSDQVGWAHGFAASQRDAVTAINLARPGYDPKRFLDEGHWQAVAEQAPRYVLISFGPSGLLDTSDDRMADPSAYAAALRQGVAVLQAAGARPVLITPLPARMWDDDGRLVDTTLTQYAHAVLSLAEELELPLLDVHAQTSDMYRSLGPNASEEIALIRGDGSPNDMLLNDWGGKLIGQMVADMLRREIPEFNAHWRWNGLTFPDPREGKDKQRPITAGVAGPLTRQGSRTLHVASDGSGEFATIQAALLAVPDNNADRTTIDIAPGTYWGPIIVGPSKQNVTFQGHGVEQTILTYAVNVKAPLSDSQGYFFNGCGVTVIGDGFHARDLTFQNTSGDYGQAMALRTQSDKAIIERCRLLGWQDTLLTHSKRQLFRDCHIEGRVDFIYGGSTAVFDHCIIKSKLGGYVTAANTPEDQPFGLVFLDCQLVSDDGVPTYLGRPWRGYASVTFVRCEMASHIRPEGWHNWGKPENHQTARYAEYGSHGPGANPDQRVDWARTLTDKQAEAFTIQNVLSGEDGWHPARP